MELDGEGSETPLPQYNQGLRADIVTAVSNGAPKAKVHRTEWAKVMAGARSHDGDERAAARRSFVVTAADNSSQASRWRSTPALVPDTKS